MVLTCMVQSAKRIRFCAPNREDDCTGGLVEIGAVCQTLEIGICFDRLGIMVNDYEYISAQYR